MDSHAPPFFWDDPRQDVELAAGSSFLRKIKPGRGALLASVSHTLADLLAERPRAVSWIFSLWIYVAYKPLGTGEALRNAAAVARRRRRCRLASTALPKLCDRAAPVSRHCGSMLDDAVHVLNGAHERKKVDPQEVDAPAKHYARLFWFTLGFGVGDAALFAVATAYLSYAALNVDLLLMGPCLSVFMLYTFGTLDSAVHGPRAIGLWAALWVVQTVIMVVSYAVRGEAWAQIAFWAFFFLLSATAFGWLMHMARGAAGAAPRRPARGRARADGAARQGRGPPDRPARRGRRPGRRERDYPRVYATALFSMSLLMAWFFALAIDEIAEVDVHAATARLRLRPIEAAALFFSGCVVLSGLGLYVISEQSSPRRGTAQAAGNALMLSIILVRCITRLSSGRPAGASVEGPSDADPPARPGMTVRTPGAS